MGCLEAVETTECPDTGMIFVWIFISAFHHFWFDLSFVATLAQLFHETVHIEAGGIGEQAHFLENATNVAASFVIVWEVPFFVFVDGGLWDVQRRCTHWTIGDQIFLRLNLPFGLLTEDLQEQIKKTIWLENFEKQKQKNKKSQRPNGFERITYDCGHQKNCNVILHICRDYTFGFHERERVNKITEELAVAYWFAINNGIIWFGYKPDHLYTQRFPEIRMVYTWPVASTHEYKSNQ